MTPPAPDPAQQLVEAIEQLSPATRSAMLEAVRCPTAQLISGSYVTPGGGVCPLLAAHRRGGRTHGESASTSNFAMVWDRYTATKTGRARPIAAAERQTLDALLVASLAREDRRRAEAELRRRAAAQRRERRDREAMGAIARVRNGHGARLESLLTKPGERNRAQELARRAGWAWLGAYRRYDEYRTAVTQALGAESRQVPALGIERREVELVA